MKSYRYVRAAFAVAIYYETLQDGDTDFSALTYRFDDIKPGVPLMDVVFQDLLQHGLIRTDARNTAPSQATNYKPNPRLLILVERYLTRDSWVVPPPRLDAGIRIGPVLSELGDSLDLDLFDDLFGLER